MRLPFETMRRFAWLSLPALIVACSSVPDVVFEDERTSDAASEGASSGGAASSGAPTGSSGAPTPAESPLCQERKASAEEKCCGDTPCWGNQCPNGCAWCVESCHAKDKKCCLHRGEKKCINLDEDCADELDL